MHLLLEVKWDGGRKLLPKQVIALDAPEGADKDETYIDEWLSDALTEAFGQTHLGFTVQPLLPLKLDEHIWSKVGIFEAPEVPEDV